MALLVGPKLLTVDAYSASYVNCRVAQSGTENTKPSSQSRPTKFLRETPMAEPKPEAKNSLSVSEKSPGHHSDKSPKHDHETHGKSDDIDEGTPVEEVKGPNVFERVKEEIEAIVEAILPKKKSDSHDSHDSSSK